MPKSPAREARNRDWKNRQYLLLDEIKLAAGCSDCGYTAHPDALEFDHLPGFEKEFAVGRGVGNVSKSRLLAEIEKCEVVCANCHRVRTAARR